MILLCEYIWKRCPVILLFILYFRISRNRRIVLWYCEISSWYHSSVVWMLYRKARFPINKISCLQTLLYWSEITSIGIHDIQCRSSFDSWFFSSYMMLENKHTKVQHFDMKQTRQSCVCETRMPPVGNKVKIWQKSLSPTFWYALPPGVYDVSEVWRTYRWT